MPLSHQVDLQRAVDARTHNEGLMLQSPLFNTNIPRLIVIRPRTMLVWERRRGCYFGGSVGMIH